MPLSEGGHDIPFDTLRSQSEIKIKVLLVFDTCPHQEEAQADNQNTE